jgi:hypothetical protein
MLTEAKESKFKVGDEVGIGRHGSWDYHGTDTGTVTKVNGHGHHTVEYHNLKSMDDPTKPRVKTFDAMGHERGGHYAPDRLMDVEMHKSIIKRQTDTRDRNNDLRQVSTLIEGHRNGMGHYGKIPKDHAQMIKDLIDKHTESDEK